MMIPKFDIGLDAADAITVANLKYTLKHAKKDAKRKEKKAKAGEMQEYESEDMMYTLRLIGALETLLQYHGEYGYE